LPEGSSQTETWVGESTKKRPGVDTDARKPQVRQNQEGGGVLGIGETKKKKTNKRKARSSEGKGWPRKH